MRSSRLAAAALWVLAGLCPPASCADPAPQGMMGGGQIVVRVRTTGGERLGVPALVRVTSASGAVQYTQGIPGSGDAVFSNVPLDGYNVDVSAPGYKPAREQVQLPIAARAQVDVYMIPEAGANLHPPPATPPLLAPRAQRAVDQGLEAFQRNDWKEAREQFERARRLAPGHPDVRYLLGVVFFKLNDLCRAEEELQTATRLDPAHARATATLGAVLFNLNDFPGTIRVLQTALALNPASWESHWTIARAFYRERQYAQSRAHAERALELAGDKSPEIRLVLARALGALGQREKAIECLEAFLRLAPQHLLSGRAREWLRQLRQEKAPGP